MVDTSFNYTNTNNLLYYGLMLYFLLLKTKKRDHIKHLKFLMDCLWNKKDVANDYNRNEQLKAISFNDVVIASLIFAIKASKKKMKVINKLIYLSTFLSLEKMY
jgi:hypothetical protein